MFKRKQYPLSVSVFDGQLAKIYVVSVSKDVHHWVIEARGSGAQVYTGIAASARFDSFEYAASAALEHINTLTQQKQG